MRFILMSTSNENKKVAPPTPELMAALGKLTEEMTKEGKLISTGGLMPSARGARLHLSGGRVTVTDGPFTEAKEMIGGYAIVQVNSKEEAIELGKRFLKIHADILGPSYETESEIRQMFDPSDFGPQKR
ncbi:MAG: YciI family protein [Acidobacteriia bacterium]|nr:YciI family protein [Terriglobia bacterium]